MKTIYQLLINKIPSKYVFQTEIEAINLMNSIKHLYKYVSVYKIEIHN
jgi:hypothetical protein